MKLLKQLVCSWSIAVILCCCTVGPDYKKPEVTSLTPADWRWKVAEPKDAIPKGEWWTVFNDPVLDELETEALANNQNLRAAVARVDQPGLRRGSAAASFFRRSP